MSADSNCLGPSTSHSKNLGNNPRPKSTILRPGGTVLRMDEQNKIKTEKLIQKPHSNPTPNHECKTHINTTSTRPKYDSFLIYHQDEFFYESVLEAAPAGLTLRCTLSTEKQELSFPTIPWWTAQTTPRTHSNLGAGRSAGLVGTSTCQLLAAQPPSSTQLWTTFM